MMKLELHVSLRLVFDKGSLGAPDPTTYPIRNVPPRASPSPMYFSSTMLGELPPDQRVVEVKKGSGAK